jgi:hypothetical protein
MQDLYIDHYQVEHEGKVSSTILSFFQMNNVTASGLICPHYTCSPTLQLVLFYDVPPLMMVPEQVHLHGQWLGEGHQKCPSTGRPRGDPVGMIFFAFFISPDNGCLDTCFLFDITVPTVFVLQPHKWLKIFELENHL